MKRCPYCEVGIPDNVSICPVCGRGLSHNIEERIPKRNTSANRSFWQHLGHYLGDSDITKIKWESLFVDTFKRHSIEEAEEIFTYGTAKTTPPISELASHWPHPWLYMRVLLVFFICFGVLALGIFMFDNPLLFPGYCVIGSLMMPAAMLVLLYEMNSWRNISIFTTTVVFLIGGGSSIIAALFLFLFGVDTDLSTIYGAIGVGLIEEISKAIIVFLILRYFIQCPTVLNGLLIGGAVGAGFATFESAGYAFSTGSEIGSLISIIMRSILAPGGHIAWAAIAGAALVLASNHKAMTAKCLISETFWKIFLIPIVLHILWDAPILNGLSLSWIKYTGLFVIAWIVLILLTNIGLSELDKNISASKRH